MCSAPKRITSRILGRIRSVRRRTDDLLYVSIPHASASDLELQLFRSQVVYLTGDSDNELQELSEDEAYIIGAMVDHNRHKGITYKRAIEAGIRHARLPLDK